MPPKAELESYLWRGVRPLGDQLQVALAKDKCLRDAGVRPVVQVYLRSHHHYYPCYLPDAGGVLQSLSPLLTKASNGCGEYVASLLKDPQPQFWLWGDQDEEHLPGAVANSLPLDLLVAAFCRLDEDQFKGVVSSAAAEGERFPTVADRIQQTTAKLRIDEGDERSVALNMALLIELGSSALYGHTGDESTLGAIGGAFSTFAKNKDQQALQTSLVKHVAGCVAYTCVPITYSDISLGMLGVMLWAGSRPDDEAASAIIASATTHLSVASARFNALYWALKPLWVVHCQAHHGSPIELDKLLSSDDPAIPIISGAANSLGGRLSLVHELRHMQRALLQARRSRAQAMKYAIVTAAYEYRSALQNGDILAVKTGRDGSHVDRLMFAAGFAKAGNAYARQANGGTELRVSASAVANELNAVCWDFWKKRESYGEIRICRLDFTDPPNGATPRGAVIIFAKNKHASLPCSECTDDRGCENGLRSAVGVELNYHGTSTPSDYSVVTLPEPAK